MSTMRVAALTIGEMSPMTLFTLRGLSRSRHRLSVVHAAASTPVSPRTRFRRLAREYGVLSAASRAAGSLILAPWDNRTLEPLYEAFFDMPALSEWWATDPLPLVEVRALNGDDCHARLRELDADLLVRVSGGILRPGTFTAARHGTINLHHGLAPAVRGMWSIPWGVLEGRQDWIGATVHQIDEGIDTGPVYSRVSPQVAPGDTADTLLFRTHVEAVEALVSVIDAFAANDGPPPAEVPDEYTLSAYRTAPGLGPWLRYLASGRGRRAPVVLDRALR